MAAALLVGILPIAGASAATRYSLDVSKRADFVAQTNFVQCVGASMQMMLNMIEPGRDRSSKTQLRLQNLARHVERIRGPTADSARAPASAAGRPA